jgi:hypothetical protein
MYLNFRIKKWLVNFFLILRTVNDKFKNTVYIAFTLISCNLSA